MRDLDDYDTWPKELQDRYDVAANAMRAVENDVYAFRLQSLTEEPKCQTGEVLPVEVIRGREFYRARLRGRMILEEYLTELKENRD